MRKQGFTLIELLVVIAIVGILSTAGFVTFSSSQARARDTSRTADLRRFEGMMETYYADHGNYPVSSADYGVADYAWGGSFADYGILPKDSLPNQRYVYVSNGLSYQLYTKFENGSTSQPFACGSCGPNNKCNGGLTSPGSSLTSFSASSANDCSTPPSSTPSPGLYTITAHVFVDFNKNGVQDGGDINYSGAQINLVSIDSGSSNQTGSSDSNGNHAFPNLLRGNYSVTLTPIAGYTMPFYRNSSLPPSTTVKLPIQAVSLNPGTLCSIDNDCASHHCYVDEDMDGYPPAAGGVNKCQPNARLASVDCDDNNQNVYPGQTRYFDIPRSNGSFDYNCDNQQIKQLGLDCLKSYNSPPGVCRTSQPSGTGGYEGAVPNCGESGIFEGCFVFQSSPSCDFNQGGASGGMGCGATCYWNGLSWKVYTQTQSMHCR